MNRNEKPEPIFKKLPDTSIVFCSKCGCHYSEGACREGHVAPDTKKIEPQKA